LGEQSKFGIEEGRVVWPGVLNRVEAVHRYCSGLKAGLAGPRIRPVARTWDRFTRLVLPWKSEKDYGCQRGKLKDRAEDFKGAVGAGCESLVD
jgi:hypothetical protein